MGRISNAHHRSKPAWGKGFPKVQHEMSAAAHSDTKYPHQCMAVLHKVNESQFATTATCQPCGIPWGCWVRLVGMPRFELGCRFRQGVLSAPCLPFHHIPVALYRVSTPVRRNSLPGVEAIGVPMDSAPTFPTLPFRFQRIGSWRVSVLCSLSYPRLGVLPAFDRSVFPTHVYSASI